MSKQEKQEEKPEAPKADSSVADAIKAAISEALPLATALAAQAMANQHPAPAPYVGPAVPFLKQALVTCGECGQKTDAAKTKGCKGEHRLAIVFSDDEEEAQWFQGVKINGVRYLSNHPGHYITVPKDCNVEYMVAEHTRLAKQLRVGRKNNRHSGSIGATNNFNAYNGGDWGKK